MDPKAFGKKIRRLREQRGLTQEAVEKAARLPQKALTHMEAGARSVSTLELSKLAAVFHLPIADFFEKLAEEEDLLVALFRAAPNLEKSPKVRDKIATCIHICREGANLQKLLGLTPPSVPLMYPFATPQTSIEAIAQGENIAEQERKRLELGDEPIHDLSKLLAKEGIWTASTVLPEEVSGFCLHHASVGTVILVNATHGDGRRRFSYAHEYAHALFDQERMIAISTVNSTLLETRANAFAAAFLMPSTAVAHRLRSLGKGEASRSQFAVFNPVDESATEAESRREASSQKISPQDVALLAHHFGVSYQATVYRLQTLRYVNRDERETLLESERIGKEYLRALDLTQTAEKPQDAGAQRRELKASVAHFAMEAYRREEISRGRLLELAKLLELPGEVLLRLAQEAI